MDRIRLLEQGQVAPQEVSRVRQKPISLPSPQKEVDGSIKVVNVYHWIKMICRAVDELHLPRDYVLYQLSNDFKLPSGWREVFAGSDDLEVAFQRIRQRVPPLQASFPELVAALTNKPPTSGLNVEVIERCGEHLSSISALQALFVDQDITRENCLAALASVGQTHELNALMVQTVRQFDHYKRLPPTDPNHRSYLDQLRLHLEEERQTRQDIEASILCGRTGENPIATVPSFAVGISKPGESKTSPRRRGGRQSAPPRSEDSSTWNNSDAKKGERGKTCGICNETAQSHPPWRCKKLGNIRNGTVVKPQNLCGRCCAWQKQDSPHPPQCGEKIFTEKNGQAKKQSFLCAAHGSSHYLLCTRCGNGPVQKAKSVPWLATVPSCAGTITSLAAPPRSSETLPSVVFMSEVVTIQSKTGEELPAICYFDTMGGSNFSTQVPEEFNHGQAGAQSSPFNLSTLHGTEEYNLPMVTMRIKKKGSWDTFEFMVTPLPTMPCVQLTESLLATCKIEQISPSQYDNIKVRLILGVQESTVFPVPVKTPNPLLSQYPGISTWRSRLSGKLLLQGRVAPSSGDQTGLKRIPSCVSHVTPEASNTSPASPTPKAKGKGKPKELRKKRRNPPPGGPGAPGPQ